MSNYNFCVMSTESEKTGLFRHLDREEYSEIFTFLLNEGFKDIETNILYKEYKRNLRTIEMLGDDFVVRLRKHIQNLPTRKNNPSNFILKTLDVPETDLFEQFGYDLQPSINILLGRNGFGKSYLLRYITALLAQKTSILIDEFLQKNDKIPIFILTDIFNPNNNIDRNEVNLVRLLAIPDVRFINRTSRQLTAIPQEWESISSGYGWYHFLERKPLENIINNFLVRLCIIYLNNEKGFEQPIFRFLEKVLDELIETSSPKKNHFKFVRVDSEANTFYGPKFILYVQSPDMPKPQPIQNISQGMLSTLVLFGFIYDFVETKDNPSHSAVVLIDEIDAHLHPSWQRRIVGLLRKYFPNIQFILTAHSPLVVAGCKIGEVSVLRKNPETQKMYLHQYDNKDFIGEGIENILDDVFEVEEYDEVFLKYLNQLKKIKDLQDEIITLNEKENADENDIRNLKTKMEDYHYMIQVKKKFGKQFLSVETL